MMWGADREASARGAQAPSERRGPCVRAARAPAARREHLVVAVPNWVGDAVMATPVLEAALASERFERVTLTCRRGLAALFGGGPLEGRVREHAGGASELALWRELAPDALLLLSNSLGAAWRAWRSGVPLRAGSALSARRAFLTHALVPPTLGGRRLPIPTAHLHRDVAGLLGIHAASLHPRLYATAAERDALRETLRGLGLGDGEPFAVCAPGAAFGAAKLWPPPRFAELLDRVARRTGWRGVVSGGPGEEPLMEAVAKASRQGALSLAGVPRTLSSLRALIAQAELLVVGDSGPRWVAAAFDVPCLSILGPNVPQLTASSLERCEIVRLEGLACSPCARRTCPLGHHRCMRDLSVDAVEEALERLLDRCAPATESRA